MEKPKMLVIDDEYALRHLYRRVFTSKGFRVLTAPDGPSGLALARAEAPEIILLDIAMAGMDGLRVFRELKQDRRTAGLRVVLITALDVPETLLKAATVGLRTGSVHVKTNPLRLLSRRVEEELAMFGGLEFDESELSVRRSGSPWVKLPAKPFLVLRLLAENPRGLSRRRLHDAVWMGVGSEREVAVAVVRLRKAIGRIGGCRVETLEGGYRLVMER